MTETPIWNPGSCLPAFPSSGDHKDVEKLQELAHTARHVDKLPADYKPVNVDDPNPLGRLEETLAGRKRLCVYDEKMQAAKALHFQCNHKLKVRMLVHFYAFLFFEVSEQKSLWNRCNRYYLLILPLFYVHLICESGLEGRHVDETIHSRSCTIH